MTYQGSITLVDLSDGQSGSSGINTATIYLYKRAATVPNKPNGTLRYTFSTHTLSGDYFNEWEDSIDNLSGNNPIWIIAATATASVDIDYDDILYTEWSNPIKIAENGQDGQPGQPGQPGQDGTPGINTATVYIYQRAGSTPSTPANTSYTFATGSFIVPTNWYKEIPTTDGNPCYVASAVAISTEATVTLEWSTPVILVEDGTDGQPGLPGESGAQGASVAIERELYYLKTNSTPVSQITEISQITSTDRQNGWTSISPTYVNGGSYYTCVETTLNNDGVTELIWSEPVLNQGLTIANANASLAISQADAVNTQLGGHFIYKGTSSGQSTPAGAGVIQTINDNPANWGYNTWIGSNGIQLRRGEVADAILSTNGLVLSKGGIRVNTVGSNNGVYISSDNLGSSIPLDNNIKTNWRAVIGSKFGVDSEGNLYANNANIEGAITATSLTIGNGSSAYDGAAAINISGYDIEIEKNGTDEVEDVSVYLYPILYHNGTKVPTTEVNYSHFIWYQDDDTIGTEGDGENRGRYLATYGHNYRVIYDFDDGAVGGGTEIQTRTVDPSKYITKVSDTGITIHPEVWSNQSSYIQLDANGLNLFDSNGNSIAQYGNTARIGLNNSSRFLINFNSLQAYDDNNNKYFEVNANGLSWGTQTAATTQQVSNLSTIIDGKADVSDIPTTVVELSDGANYSTTTQMNTAINSAVDTAVDNLTTSITNAAKTATNYITKISNTGITIHPEVWTNQSSYIQLDGTGMELFNNSGSSIAKYGSTARVGLNNSSRFLMNSDSLEAYDSNNVKYFEVNSSGLSWGNNTAATTNDVEDAAKTATNYITYINSENGIRIYDGQDINEDLNYAQVNSAGMQIYKNNEEVASFGHFVRVGADTDNSAKIFINPSNNANGLTNMLEMQTRDGVSAFLQQTDDNRYVNAGANLGFAETVYAMGSQSVSTTSSTKTASFTVAPLRQLSNNTDFTLTFITQLYAQWNDIVYSTRPSPYVYNVIFNFTKGISKTLNITQVEGEGKDPRDNAEVLMGITHTYDVTYDGNYTITLTSTVQQFRDSAPSGNSYYDTVQERYEIENIFLARLKYDADNKLMPVLRLCGDIILGQDGIGSTFIELDIDSDASATTDATYGKDKNLFNVIRSLNWYNPVISGIILNQHYATVTTTSDIVVLEATTTPPGLEVTWQIVPEDEQLQINEGIVTVRSNFGGFTNYTVTASTIFMGEVLSDSCIIRTEIPG